MFSFTKFPEIPKRLSSEKYSNVYLSKYKMPSVCNRALKHALKDT